MAKKEETKEVSELVYIQSRLKAPKNQRNNFGGYAYRSCEDIMEAVKPLLLETNCSLVVGDDIVIVGDRIYVKATAILRLPSGETITNTAFAREPLTKKGSDESQITGATSSYARKYALNGLFCIDDTKDVDVTGAPTASTVSSPDVAGLQAALAEINTCTTTDALLTVWNKYVSLQKDANFTGAMTARKDQIAKNGKK